MRSWLFFVLLTPLIELYVLIEVGAYIGAWPTVLLVVASALLGVALLRHQGFAVLAKGVGDLQTADAQAQQVIVSFLGALGAALLVVPGFITDVLGLALLILPLRVRIAARTLDRLVAAMPPPPRDGPQGRVIEGEFERRP